MYILLRCLARALTPVLYVLERINLFKVEKEAIVLPSADHVPHTPSSLGDIDAAVARVCESRESWAALGSQDRARLLVECQPILQKHWQAIAADSARVRGMYGHGLGEEMLLNAPLLHVLTDYVETLKEQAKPSVNNVRDIGHRCIVDAWPRGMDNLFFGGARGEIWIKPGARASQGASALGPVATGALPGVAAVLGAGNHLCVVVRDIVHQLAVCDNLVVVKLNPCNDYIGPHVSLLLEPFVMRGFVQVVYGGAKEAQALVHDPRVASVFMTGSTATYNAILWGAKGPQGGGSRELAKPFEAELGCVTPHVVVPSKAKWSSADLEYHAALAVSSVVLNSGHNCNATEVIITARGWPQRQEFVKAVERVLNSAYERWPWYPGSSEKMEAFRARFKQARSLGVGACSMARCTTPYLFASDLTPSTAQLGAETWSPVVQELSLEAPLDVDGAVDVAAFLTSATRLVNEQCFGTLSCSLSVHPETQRRHGPAVEAALSDLRYGHIVVNHPAIAGYIFCRLPWGAWCAAGTPEDIGSGNVLSSSTCFDHAEKGVMRYPFRLAPKSLADPRRTGLETMMMRYMQYVLHRNPWTAMRLLIAALRSK